MILGPNNGGKTQFLRSLVLLAACRRIFSPSEPNYPAPFRGSLAQNLTEMGFQDLAEELPRLIGSSRPLRLSWRAPFPDSRSLLRALVDSSEERSRLYSRPPRLKPTSQTSSIEYKIVLTYDNETKEILLDSCDIKGLWEGLRLRIRGQIGEDAQAIRRQTPDWFFGLRLGPLPGYSVRFDWRGRKYDSNGIARALLRTVRGNPPRALSDSWRRSWGLRWLVRVAFAQLPSVVYLGPIRIRDDRAYTVASSQGQNVVGRQGEYTWVQLQELEQQGERRRDWFQSKASAVAGITGVRGERDSPTVPRVMAEIGTGRSYSLHDFGLGTSQVLPILVQMAVTLPPKTQSRLRRGREAVFMVVEEPETHLHPAAQQALARAMAEYVGFGGRIVVETHSEVFIRAVEAAIAGGDLKPGQAIANWVQLLGKRTGPFWGVSPHPFDKAGAMAGGIPPTFDEVVPGLIEERILHRKTRSR
jgi:hypothetical protein